MIIAEFYNGTKNRPAVVDIVKLSAGQRFPVETREVSGKRDARLIAEFFGAKPWNF